MRRCEFCRDPGAVRYGVPPTGEESYILCPPCASVTAASLRANADECQLFTIRLDRGSLPEARTKPSVASRSSPHTEPHMTDLSA